MKIVALSDSHGDVKSINKVIETNPDLNVLLHAGDYAKDARKISAEGFQVYYVKGNCDKDDEANTEEILEFDGVKILLIHGDTYSVKYKLNMLADYAKSVKADLTVFGHTHKPLVINKHGALMLNPGTVNTNKSFGAATYAVITIENGDITAAKLMKV